MGWTCLRREWAAGRVDHLQVVVAHKYEEYRIVGHLVCRKFPHVAENLPNLLCDPVFRNPSDVLVFGVVETERNQYLSWPFLAKHEMGQDTAVLTS